ncbi:MAG: AraC family transcriptional regulator, partial [Treponema sp.]|nr:AraC family transcriptional regulator [Treponema sp.]
PLPVFSHIGVRKEFTQIFGELFSAYLDKEPGYTFRINGLFLLLIHRLVELSANKHDDAAKDFRIIRAKRYIEKHFTDNLPVHTIADKFNLNPIYFDALFKKETNMTIHQYLIRTRIRNALNMLRSGEYKVREVAESCGYDDTLYFSKQFKAVMGFPPSQALPKWNK